MLAGDQGVAVVAVASSHCINRLCSSGIDSASVLNEDAIQAWRSRRGGIGPAWLSASGLEVRLGDRTTFLTPSRG